MRKKINEDQKKNRKKIKNLRVFFFKTNKINKSLDKSAKTKRETLKFIKSEVKEETLKHTTGMEAHERLLLNSHTSTNSIVYK